ncbi:septin and tuftelin-interacting protein 1 homolog 1-like [Solanum dulcamara]|uniref:septin and tuftelin-interacting protein 1 homolog 1-like n=1 Tax=Solanum dulcamara TaxID=45834 RepID=UPI0024868A28|nr:septin and tuftelin-interacting protein 1 homolog 1-like [Solanum dulcamara]
MWKNLLEADGIPTISNAESPYSQLFMEVVFPVVRISCTNIWQARQPEPMILFLELWEKLLPPAVLQTIMENIVLPKLSAAVDSWDPRRETIPIHSWVHPWLPLLGQKLESFYFTIRSRLKSVLHAWHQGRIYMGVRGSPEPPQSKNYVVYKRLNLNIMDIYPLMNRLSAIEKNGLATVFDSINWENLMVSFIVPKLNAVMKDFQINPEIQYVDQFYWVLTWATVVPIQHMNQVMDIFLQEFLCCWLHSSPDFEVVTKWFLGSKEILPPELLANEHVCCRLSLGLGMMNQAIEGLVEFPSGGDLERLKDIIEVHAQKNCLLFKPKTGRTQDGHQIYGFGNISIIIDSFNQKVFAHIEDRWCSVSLDQLVDLQNLSDLKSR